MNNDLDIAKRFSNNIVTLREPKPLFPIITPDSLLYKFARSQNKNIKKKFSKGELPLKMDMSLKKIKKYLK